MGLMAPHQNIYCYKTFKTLWRRSRPIQSCSASREEEEEAVAEAAAASSKSVKICGFRMYDDIILYLNEYTFIMT
jgi:hypothetical protein